VRVSLDTHVFLWAVTVDPRLPAPVAEALLDPSVEVFVSAVCVWEVAIKVSVGRLALPATVDLVDAIGRSGFRELPVTARHAAATVELEPIHRDPFDRLLLAQAGVEELTLVSVDDQVRRYPGVRFFPEP
jgi:PIN domain nuclease of toxin-antitoxin system